MYKEENKIYNKALDDFAKWLVDKGILGSRVIYEGEIIDYGTLYVKLFKKETLKKGEENVSSSNTI